MASLYLQYPAIQLCSIIQLEALDKRCFLNQVVGIATALLELGAYIHWSRTLQTPPVQSFFF
jgi:hypothetical protein